MKKISAKEIMQHESAIRTVFEAGCSAWNRGDLDGYLASYWDSDKTIWISNGALTRGKKAIVEAYKSRFSTTQELGNLSIAELEIDVLTTMDAIAFGRWTLAVEDKTTNGLFTVQLRKIKGIWLFASDHSSTRV